MSCRGRPEEVVRSCRGRPVEVVRSCRGRQVLLGSSGPVELVTSGQLVRVDCVRPPTLEGHNSSVRAPIWVFLDSMESPLSQESTHMPEGG